MNRMLEDKQNVSVAHNDSQKYIKKKKAKCTCFFNQSVPRFL